MALESAFGGLFYWSVFTHKDGNGSSQEAGFDII
jgi:hypothetical protein